MDVWFTWARNEATCEWCPDKIKRKTPMVVTKLWNKGQADSRKWNIIHRYHPACYLAQGLDYLDKHPFTEVHEGEVKGRPAIQLSPEDRKKRLALLKKRAALDQRLKNLKKGYHPEADYIVREAAIYVEIAQVIQEIVTVGGIPKSWAGEK